jgi:hypothetical protein
MARKFLAGNIEHPEVAPLLANEHFTVDGTLVTVWASLKSFVPKKANDAVATTRQAGPRSGFVIQAAF